MKCRLKDHGGKLCRIHRLRWLWLGLWVGAVALSADRAVAQAPFYQGKSITMLHGRAPGGSADFRVRAVLPFLQKYIPGNPTFVHEYMDGGGGRKAANHIFALTRTDGLVIGNVGGGVVANAVLGEQGVQYDLDKPAQERCRRCDGLACMTQVGIETNHRILQLVKANEAKI